MENIDTEARRETLPLRSHTFLGEMQQQVCLAGPSIAVRFLIFFIQLISLAFVGHLGELALSGASVATSVASVTGFSLMRGMAGAMETFCGQSYGARQYNLLGIHLQRDPEVSAEAGLYARFLIPSIIGFTSLGSKGPAVATIISYMLNSILLILYVWMSPACQTTWTGFSVESFRGIPNFIRLAIPSALMTSVEVWSFELLVLLGGLLPNPKLQASVLSISLNTCTIFFQIPVGLGNVICTRVSNELGAGRPEVARLAIRVALSLVTTEGLMVASIMLLGRKSWGKLYSHEHEVVKYAGKILVYVAVSHIIDALQAVLSGICRACGKQRSGAIINLGSYYIVGIPCGVVLAFVFHVGGPGLWIGIIAALVVQALLLSILTIKTNWEHESKRAIDRNVPIPTSQ
ncbi:hypothetical protein ACFE04_012889 [Oxalis oulophora]